jgi:hypothetical protein
MNIKAFKRLIKEAVAEAIYEEMPEIIAEVAKQMNKQPLTENRTLSFTSADVPGDKLYQSVNDRNWKELQKNKEEILKNASNASQQLNTKHGITAKPRI